ncbi:hypothetical protein PtB15_4B736 [Puccinia triticina]|nr:hypothetical protein PtB15_4B736 [Puccinia triticina]
MTPDAGPSDPKGKQKALAEEPFEEEPDIDEEVASEVADNNDEDNCPKSGRGRPRKAILKDAAKRLKKL